MITLVDLRASGERDLLGLALSVIFGAHRDAPPPSEDHVRRWVEAARRGDEDAARALYRAHVAKVFRTVRPLCREDAEAEDVTQETFARALEALDTYAPRPDARFVSWLLAIAMNVARKTHRRRRRTVTTSPDALIDATDRASSTPDDPAGALLDERTLRRALFAALAELEPREREIVTLRYGGELDAREIAEITGLQHAHVRKIAQRARDALRAHIERALAARPSAEETA